MKTDSIEVPSSPGWVRPCDVMRVRKLRAKKNALKARMSSNINPILVKKISNSEANNKTVYNPFRRSPVRKSHPVIQETSSDTTLFHLLNQPQQTPSIVTSQYTFSQALRQHGIPPAVNNQEASKPEIHWADSLIVDWSLKTKLRFISDKPLPWKHNFKTSEEASGTTGMARCLWGDTTNSDSDLDTSPNAEFYQRCLVWQHPSLPGVQLFPRDNIKTSASGGGSATGPYADPRLSSALHASWCESLRSLHQLIRVRQCPFFYVCAPSFTVLYRSAGVCGIPHAHAFITPTTSGLRKALKEECIDYKMPFHKSSSDGSSSDGSSTSSSNNSTKRFTGCDELPDDLEEDDEEEEASSFLANLGVDASQFANLNPNRNKAAKDIDRSPLSMAYIADPDTQGLTNFLLNSPSCTPTTGPLAGVPPTLLAPVAFHSATLLPNKMKGSTIRVKGETHYSMEVTGPLLPHTALQLSSVLTQHVSSFTLSTTPLLQTLPFTNCTAEISKSSMTKAFAEEGLVDCGLEKNIRSLVCQPLRSSTDPPPLLPTSYREVTYDNGKFTWTDKLPVN